MFSLPNHWRFSPLWMASLQKVGAHLARTTAAPRHLAKCAGDPVGPGNCECYDETDTLVAIPDVQVDISGTSSFQAMTYSSGCPLATATCPNLSGSLFPECDELPVALSDYVYVCTIGTVDYYYRSEASAFFNWSPGDSQYVVQVTIKSELYGRNTAGIPPPIPGLKIPGPHSNTVVDVYAFPAPYSCPATDETLARTSTSASGSTVNCCDVSGQTSAVKWL